MNIQKLLDEIRRLKKRIKTHKAMKMPNGCIIPQLNKIKETVEAVDIAITWQPFNHVDRELWQQIKKELDLK